MEAPEAIKAIMEALGDRVADFDEHFGIINDAIKVVNTGEKVDDFEKKYNDLKEKYIARFSDSFNYEKDKEGDYALDDATDGSPAVTLNDLDFNASTE